MANVLVQESSISQIARAIRYVGQINDPLTPGEMADAIKGLYLGNTEKLTVTENGLYVPEGDRDGFSLVSVDVHSEDEEEEEEEEEYVEGVDPITKRKKKIKVKKTKKKKKTAVKKEYSYPDLDLGDIEEPIPSASTGHLARVEGDYHMTWFSTGSGLITYYIVNNEVSANTYVFICASTSKGAQVTRRWFSADGQQAGERVYGLGYYFTYQGKALYYTSHSISQSMNELSWVTPCCNGQSAIGWQSGIEGAIAWMMMYG